MPAEPAPKHDDLLVLQFFSCHFDGAKNGSQGDSRRSLDVVIERQQFIVITLKNGSSMRCREVFPLQAGFRKFLLHRLNKLIHEVKIFLSCNPFMPPAEVLGIAEPFRIVGSHIQNDRERAFRTNAADQRV